jgi:hypothetical protein
LTLPERRGLLPNFWHQLTNDQSCLQTQFLNHFNEPLEFRSYIRRDRCCSICNTNLQLNDLDSYYLYNERGSGNPTKHKKVLELVTAWGEEQVITVFQNPAFRPTVYCFLSENQLNQLAREPYPITDVNTLCKVIGPWGLY